MAGLRTHARSPKELLIKCRLKVLAWGENGSMPLSADNIFGEPQRRHVQRTQREREGAVLAFLFLLLQSSSRRYLSEAHSWMTASIFGIVTLSSLSSTTPSAMVSATLSKASPTSLIRLETATSSFSSDTRGSGILKATLPAWLSSKSSAS